MGTRFIRIVSFVLVIVGLFVPSSVLSQTPTTQVTDTVYYGDGTAASGTVLISWNAFTTSTGETVPSGSVTATLGSSGSLNVSLVPNANSVPAGAYYAVTYQFSNGTTAREYWIVPVSSTPVAIASLRSSVLPSAVAAQVASISYVNAAIAKAQLSSGTSATNVSSLSGQTPNYVPVATSTTASTTSSHFFENSNTSGVYNGFLGSVAASNCKNTGALFTRYGCNQFNVWDDGSIVSNTTNSLTGTEFSFNSAGGAGSGNAEGRTTQVLGDYGAVAHAGIFNIWQSTTARWGVGDTLFMNWNHNCFGGVAYQSDQGCQLIYNYGGEGVAGGHFNYNLDAGSGGVGKTTFTFSGNGFGCNSPLNQKCVPSPGLWMIDRQTPTATGNFTAPSTADGTFSWLSNITTNQTTLPTVTSWAASPTANIAGGGAWGQQTAQTFTSTIGSGVLAAGDTVCAMGNQFQEQGTIVSVTGSAPTETITLNLSHPNTDLAIFKGSCHYIELSQGVALGDYAVVPAVSLDGSHWTYGLAMYSGFGGGFPATGEIPETFDNTATSGWRSFCGSRVTQIDNIDPPITAHLEPNTCTWNDNDAVTTPDLFTQKVNGIVNTSLQYGSSSDYAYLAGFTNNIDGMGASGAAVGIENNNMFSRDCTAYNFGTCGGKLAPPTAYANRFGYWGNLFTGNATPAYNGFAFSNHWPGQTGYTIWSDPTWGSLSIDNTNTWKFTNANLWVQTNFTAGGNATVSGNATIGSNRAGFSTLDVRNDGGQNNKTIGRFAGSYAGTPAGSTMAQLRLGIVNGGDNWEADKAYWALRDDGAGHQGFDLGRFDNSGNETSALYMSPDEQGQHLSIMNGHTNCGQLICLGPNLSINGNTIIPTSNNVNITNTDPGFTGITLTNTGTNGDQWGIFSVSNASFTGGHKLGIVNTTAGNWGWVLSLDSVTSGYIENPSFLVNCWSSSIDVTRHACDLGLSRESAGVLDVGNGTPSDTSGTLKAATVNAQVYKGPDTAPTGACSTTGWAFSQDGHISFCNGTTWIQKM